jgi:hypothetical protein
MFFEIVDYHRDEFAADAVGIIVESIATQSLDRHDLQGSPAEWRIPLAACPIFTSAADLSSVLFDRSNVR